MIKSLSLTSPIRDIEMEMAVQLKRIADALEKRNEMFPRPLPESPWQSGKPLAVTATPPDAPPEVCSADLTGPRC